jgi:NTE family protein
VPASLAGATVCRRSRLGAGVPAGLADAAVDVTEADFLLGTSAGSVVAAQVTGGADVAAPFQGR